jgi:hypothetical protein
LKNLVSLVGRCTPTDPQKQAWLASARALVAVPDSIVNTIASYTRDPVALYDYRRQVAEAIVQGIPYAGGDIPPDADGEAWATPATTA